jgi:hypothetical protein
MEILSEAGRELDDAAVTVKEASVVTRFHHRAGSVLAGEGLNLRPAG